MVAAIKRGHTTCMDVRMGEVVNVKTSVVAGLHAQVIASLLPPLGMVSSTCIPNVLGM